MKGRAGAQPVRGSLLTSDGLHFRITQRCLVNDLGLPPRAPFARALDGPIGSAIRSMSDVGGPSTPALSRPVGVVGEGNQLLIVHPTAGGRLLWIVAAGRDEVELRQYDDTGVLWPTDQDVTWLQSDALAGSLT